MKEWKPRVAKKDNPQPTDKLAREIFERDGYVCQGCRVKLPCVLDVSVKDRDPWFGGYKVLFLIVDHIDGPSMEASNLQALCWRCNSAKSGRGGNSFKLSLALKRLGPCMTYYPSIAAIVGLKESIFLCQLIYWTPRGRHEKGEGWIYKSVEEMAAETGLGYKEQIRVRSSLVEGGLLEEQYERNEHRLYFRIVPEQLDILGDQIDWHMPVGQVLKSNQAPTQKAVGTCSNVSSIEGSKDYTEITHKNKPDFCNSCDGTGLIHQAAHIPGPRLIQCPDCQPKRAAQTA